MIPGPRLDDYVALIFERQWRVPKMYPRPLAGSFEDVERPTIGRPRASSRREMVEVNSVAPGCRCAFMHGAGDPRRVRASHGLSRNFDEGGPAPPRAHREIPEVRRAFT
jgi:hypothetical protein